MENREVDREIKRRVVVKSQPRTNKQTGLSPLSANLLRQRLVYSNRIIRPISRSHSRRERQFMGGGIARETPVLRFTSPLAQIIESLLRCQSFCAAEFIDSSSFQCVPSNINAKSL
jgi:hypothetical protein